jgi:hypothetical protein
VVGAGAEPQLQRRQASLGFPFVPAVESAGGTPLAAPPSRPRLLDELRAPLRVRNYAYRTEQVYADWMRRFILFHGRRHPREMGALEVTAFLSHLATERCVSASTQNQAKSAILFLYSHVLAIDLPWLAEVVSAKVSRR